jgi:hypothetical protein
MRHVIVSEKLEIRHKNLTIECSVPHLVSKSLCFRELFVVYSYNMSNTMLIHSYY